METETEKTLPRSGLVSQIRQNWSVFEDEALAQQMQQQEISSHLLGNRSRNRILREDIPLSRQEQQIEQQQASADFKQYKEKLDEVAERDAEVARDLAWQQETRFKFDAQYVAKRDEAFAKNLQRIEREYREKRAREGDGGEYHQQRAGGEMSYHDLGGGLQYHEDQYQLKVARPAMVTEEPLYVNNNNNVHSSQEPGHNISSEFSGGRSSRTSRTSSRSESSMASTTTSEVGGACGGAAAADPSDYIGLGSALSPAELRAAEAAERRREEELEQERRDMEIARRLQDQLSAGDNTDRKLAIEAQDHEFAKVLQAKEKAKAKRAREKARQRKLERQRQEAESQSHSEDPDAIFRVPDDPPRPSTSTSDREDTERSPRSPPELKPPSRRPYVHEGAIDSHVNDTYCTRQITPAHSESEESEPRYANIRKNGEPVNEEPILAIKKSGKHKSQPSVLDTDMPTPPYMPMQPSTSKKSASLERKIKKKKEKEGCKQQ